MTHPLAPITQRICVFCGSALGANAAYRQSAASLGAELASRGLGLVFGGGKVGLMGVVADATLAGGGHAIGVIPSFLSSREIAHDGLPDLRVVGSMHERKALMANLSDAFVVLPGGMGTLDEMCEILTWAQLGLHQKPVGLLNTNGYFDEFVAFLDRAVAEGFVRAEHRRLLVVETDPVELLIQLTAARPAVASAIDERV
jgi:uncharacterized protein (TIGR00730 family)